MMNEWAFCKWNTCAPLFQEVPGKRSEHPVHKQCCRRIVGTSWGLSPAQAAGAKGHKKEVSRRIKREGGHKAREHFRRPHSSLPPIHCRIQGSCRESAQDKWVQVQKSLKLSGMESLCRQSWVTGTRLSHWQFSCMSWAFDGRSNLCDPCDSPKNFTSYGDTHTWVWTTLTFGEDMNRKTTPFCSKSGRSAVPSLATVVSVVLVSCTSSESIPMQPRLCSTFILNVGQL